jgi:hypothetical protein
VPQPLRLKVAAATTANSVMTERRRVAKSVMVERKNMGQGSLKGR